MDPCITPEEIDRRTTYHPPTEEAKIAHVQVRAAFQATFLVMRQALPASREASLCLTKLEEAMMHANAAIARHYDKL